MSPSEKVIYETKERASEYLEMLQNPDKHLSLMLAHQIVMLRSENSFLKAMLKNENSRSRAAK